jgi:hypothetical protein
MAQKIPDVPDINSVFEEMGREAVAKAVDGDGLVD